MSTVGNAVASTWLTRAVPPSAPAEEMAARATRTVTRPLSRRGMCHRRFLVQHVHLENGSPDRQPRPVRQRHPIRRDGLAVDGNAGCGRRRLDHQPVPVASYVGMNPLDPWVAG